MDPQVNIILAIIGALGAWTASVVAAVLWLNSKFRSLEKTIYKEINKHEDEDRTQFRDHGRRIMRLELKSFGFTHTP